MMKKIRLVLRYVVYVTLLLVGLNLILFLAFAWRDFRKGASREIAVVKQYTIERLMQAYPEVDKQDVFALLQETWTRGFEYVPFTQFRERSFRGAFLNVSDRGYRHSGRQLPWPPDTANYNVFLFGGSTAFGYGLPDDKTVAAFLQQEMDVVRRGIAVYNFAGGFYYSTQERILFEQLVAEGNGPDMAIFIDGLNDFHWHLDQPAYTQALERFMDRGEASRTRKFTDNIPMVRLADYIRFSSRLLFRAGSDEQRRRPLKLSDANDSMCVELIRRVIARYLANKEITEAVAASKGVRTVFIWQPVPMYQYDMNFHLFGGESGWPESIICLPAGYDFLRNHAIAGDQRIGVNFIWLADIQKNLKENLYVDGVHYNEVMCEKLAGCIIDSLLSRGLLDAEGLRLEQ